MTQAREMPEAGGIVPGRNRSGSDIETGRLVKVDPGNAPDAIARASAASDTLQGVTMNAIDNGKNGNVMLRGLARVTSGAAVAAGARVTSDADGKGVTASADNDNFVGVANTAAGGADESFEVQLTGPGVNLSAGA